MPDTPPPAGAARTIVGWLPSLVLAPLFYLGTAWPFGLLPGDGLALWPCLAGGLVSIAVAAVVRLVGESPIEDLVKLVLFAAGALALGAATGPTVQAIALGAPAGALAALAGRGLGRPG